MAKARCVFLITIITFASFIIQIFSTKFPEFFNEEDLRSMGVKNPEKKVFHPPSVKREPDSPPPGYESVESNEMNKSRKPPNGLPIPAVPPPFYSYKNTKFKPMGRGDPKDQNIVQQMNDQDGNAIFPRPDGQPLSGSDSIDLNLLEKRLTDTNKWDEFKNLVAKQRQKQKPGETMENWEEDAHMWASYSRQLVERDKTAKRRAQEEERKDAERKAARQNEHKYSNPSAGMEQYWTSNENDKKPSDPSKDMDAVGKEMLETLSRLPHSQSDSEGQGITGLDTYLSGTDKGRGREAFPGGPGAYSSGPGEYLRGQDTYPGGAGGFPGSPGEFPGNSGFPGSAGGYPGGAGGYPGGAGGYPGAALGYSGGSGGYPGGAGGYLGGAGGYPGGPGGYPGVAGGYPGGPGGYPGGTGGYPEGAGQFPGGSERFSGDTRGFPGGPGGFAQGPGRFPGGAAGFPGGAGGYPGGAAGAAFPGAPEGIPGGARGFPRNPGGFPGGPGGFPEGPGTYPRGSGSNPRSPEAFPGGLSKPGNNFKFPTELSLSKNAQLWNAMKQGIHLPMPPPKLWTRRQYDGMPPIYYKDRPNESQGSISTGRDDRYLTPEQRSQESPDYDMGPDTSQLSQSFEKPRIAFDENVNEANVPIGDGKLPGVGSEADFPNGYRPNYGDKSQISPGFYQMPQSYSSGYPEAQKNPFIKTQPKTTSNKSPPQIPLKNIVAESYPDDFEHALRMGGSRSQPGLGSESNFPEASSLDNFKHALRMGGPRFQPGPGSELNVPEGSGPDNSKHALRMGGPRFQPGPGSESDFSEGFHPKIAGGNMERGVPSGNGLHRPPRLNSQFQFQGMEQRGPPPGWHSEGKAGWKPDKSWGSSRFSPPGEPDYQPLPESERLQPNQPREFPVKGKDPPAALRDGADDVAITFQGQNSPGVDVELGQAGFKPRQPNLPTGYNLLQIALNKTVDEDQMIRAGPMTEPSTTPKHPPTKEERIQQLQQRDDFGAPIRWVPLTSPDTSDGLAKVTDKKTHKNQQFIIEGVLYVPVVDENVARLGLTTEDYHETTTQLPTLTPKNDSSIKTILRSMNLNKSSELEWLAMETVLGPKQVYPAQCEAESCQARCHKPKCDSKCRGEMCASGCVGVGCNANCNGPACFSMCIGEKCTAKCEGMNCESRCWGKGCEATCTLLSCIYTINGETLVTNATFDQLYPNYDNKPKNDGRQAQRVEQPEDNTKLKNEDYYY